MSTVISFPRLVAGPAGPRQLDQVITLVAASGTLALGGPATYTDVHAWHQDNYKNKAPYTAVVLEFTATNALVLGDGSATVIGLFGEIDGVGKTFLGVLGISMGATYPQIPIISATVGYSQVVCNVAAYDRLAIGCLLGSVELETDEITVIARPIVQNNYAG